MLAKNKPIPAIILIEAPTTFRLLLTGEPVGVGVSVCWGSVVSTGIGVGSGVLVGVGVGITVGVGVGVAIGIGVGEGVGEGVGAGVVPGVGVGVGCGINENMARAVLLDDNVKTVVELVLVDSSLNSQ
jgi:hypothetical protein